MPLEDIVGWMLGSRISWLVVMLAFMAAGWVARRWAQSGTSTAMQYLGLSLYVVSWAVIFLPIMAIASVMKPQAIPTAGLLTLAVFGGLTTAVFVTRKDFSFIGPALSIATWIALGAVLCLMFIPGLSGMVLLFCFAMVALMCGYILYYTSQVMYHHRTDQHVAAALELFACVATLFWYILQIVMSSSRD
jgi:FtsH-binding integral membrane protein